MFKYIGLIIVLLVIFASVATADLHWFHPPSKDTTLIEYNPDDNYGTFNYMWIGYDNGGWLDALMQFDLSGYYGVEVDSAYLWLYVDGNDGDLPPDNCWIVRITTSWDEYTITWNTFPGWTDQVYISGPSAVGVWWTIDVTSYVEGWIDGTNPNYGLALGTHDSAGDDWFNAFAKEYTGDPDLAPWLELNYHYSAIQSTSLGNIKALFE